MMQRHEPIAIIGSSCRFPGGSSTPSKLWDLLRKPRDVLRPVPSGRWDAKAYYHSVPTHHGTSDVQETYFLDEDVAAFDHSFFNIQASEAESLDPQQRILLETVVDALVDAGLPMEGLRGSNTSVFVGQMCDDWSGLLTRDWDSYPTYASTGMGRSIMSNRISYFFDWHGPSMTIDTACSSSLVAVHQAIQTLLSGESRLALAAGSNLILSPAMYVAESNLRMLSPHSRSRMWDADADGYARGEGIAAVLLKPLSAALEDGDNIECIIRASAINQDGRTPGLTMPSSSAQAQLIRETYARAGLDINNINDRPHFFQAHGTGTPAGDPQEAEAIALAFFENGNPSTKNEKLLVGSVKTVIGHTEGTAGLASLIASVQAVKHAVIPPNMLFNRLNPDIAPFYDHLEVPTAAKAWPVLASDQARRVSINSFGFGGTNAHAIIESYDTPTSHRLTSNPNGLAIVPFVFSAASESALRELLRLHADFLQTNPAVHQRDLAWTLHARRSTLPYRLAIAASSTQDLSEKITHVLNEVSEPSFDLSLRHFNKPDARILGVFTGQGAQWPRMGAKLIEQFPLVRDYVDELDKSLATLPTADRPTWTIKEELLAQPQDSKLAKAEISQPLCTAVQIILVNLLSLAGIRLHSVIGHSSGEIGAAYASGLVSAEQAIRIAYYRGLYAKLARSTTGAQGAMMAVSTSMEDAEEFCELDMFQGRLQVAASNSSSSITLSGDDDAVDEAMIAFQDEQKFARKLRVDTAYHSRHMLPCAEPYLKALDKLNFSQVTGTQGENRPIWHSSVVPSQIMTENTLESQYWVDNMTKPVLFSTAVAEAIQRSGPFDVVLEVGPHPALKGPFGSCLEDMPKSQSPPYHGLLGRGKDDVEQLSAALGQLWMDLGKGVINFDKLDASVTGDMAKKQMVTGLPPYPFNHDRSFYSLSRASTTHIHNHTAPHPLLGRRCFETTTTQETQWRNVLRPKEISWLPSHRLQGQVVFAATAYVAMAIDAAFLLADKTPSLFKLKDLAIEKAIFFGDENASIESLFTMKIIKSNSVELVAEFGCYSSLSNDAPMVRNAHGLVIAQFQEGFGPDAQAMPGMPSDTFNLGDISADRFYNSLSRLGYEYQSPFNCIREIKRKQGFSTGVIVDESGSAWEDGMIVHPGVMDTALQTISAAYCCPDDGLLFTIHVPTHIDSLILNPHFTHLGLGKQRTLRYRSFVRETFRGKTTADVHLSAEGGPDDGAFLQIEGVQLKPFSPPSAEDDAVMFAEFDYKTYHLDGALALGSDKPKPSDVERAEDLERVAYFYLRILLQTITPSERAATLPHFRKLLEWAAHVDGLVARGECLTVAQEHRADDRATIEALLAKWPDQVEAHLVRAAGENMATAIRQNGSILEHLTKDSVLDDFYRIQIAQDWLARLATQLTHRYPRMQILEIGAGTGGSTRVLLPELGAAFSSYTYTDISSGFFGAAEARFEQFANRMLFKTFDMDKAPDAQGFTEESYDLVVAANVLHVSDNLEQTMSNVRRLIKPGGYLMVFEVVSNDALRFGLPMGGLPGWWVGADSGRPWGPTLTVPQWDALLSKCGFAGIETVTPKYHDLHPGAVFAAQAVDDRVRLLRSPLDASPETSLCTSGTLTLIGGKTTQVGEIVREVREKVGKRWTDINVIASIEELQLVSLPEGSTVLCVTELDEPLLLNPTPAKFSALKVLWAKARNILWVTKGSRSDEPYSYMMVGLARAMRAEYPTINLQMLDIASLRQGATELLCETLLRLEVWDVWVKEKSHSDILWSVEPEVVEEQGGRMLIPRLYPRSESNLRYNSGRRLIMKHVNPQEVPLRLGSKHGQEKDSSSMLTLMDISPLRVCPWSTISPEISMVQIAHSLVPFIRVDGGGYAMLCEGIDSQTQEPVFALCFAAENPAPTAPSWVVPRSSSFDPARGLVALAALLTAHLIVKTAPEFGTLLVHGSDPVLAQALNLYAQSRRVQIHLTTSSKTQANCATYIHPNLPRRLVKSMIPSDVSAFVDMSLGADTHISELIRSCASQTCVVADRASFFGDRVELLQKPQWDVAASALRDAWEKAPELVRSLGDAATIPLSQVETLMGSSEPWSVLDWAVPLVPIEVHPIDNATIFEPNKTYVLVGLAGELGQSLAKWMVSRGAKHVVLTSRRPKVDPRFIESLEKQGAEVKVLAFDITNKEAVQSSFKELATAMPPVAGIANGAMVLRDSMFENMTYDDFMTCLRPKVDGTVLLDELFHDAPLDFFITFSSLTAVVGNSGQSNYAAANMFMTALAAQRKERGVAGSTMDISSLMGIGYVEHSDKLDADYFTRLGYRNIAETDLHQLFAETIIAGRPGTDTVSEIVTGVSPIYADQDVQAQFKTDLKFVHFVLDRPGAATVQNNAASAPVRTLLLEAETLEQAEDMIKGSFVARMKKTLQMDKVSEDVPLVEQGLDSLMAVEVRTWFLKELDMDMPVLKILAGGSINDLVSDAAQRQTVVSLDGDGDSPSPADIATSTTSAEDPSQGASGTPASTVADPGSPSGKDQTVHDSSSLVPDQEIRAKLSYGQTRFWFLQNLLADKKALNMAVMFQLKGPLRVDAFEQALDVVAQRHEAMRTRIVDDAGDDDEDDEEDDDDDDGNLNDEPLQGIAPRSTVHLERIDITSPEQAQVELQRMHDHEWDLHSWESVKVRLLRLSNTVHYVVVGSHHITMDGLSFSVLFVDLEAAYSGRRPLQPLPATSQPRAFASQQRRDYESGRMKQSIEFHREALPRDAFIAPIPLFPFAKSTTRPTLTHYRLHQARAVLDRTQSNSLKQLARAARATTFHVYLALLQTHVFRLLPRAATDHLCIGIADANRLDQNFIGTMGFLLNLLPIHFARSDAEDPVPFDTLVRTTRDKTYAALAHSQVPFDVLLRELDVPRSPHHAPLFQVFVDYRQVVRDRSQFGECALDGEQWINAQTGYDLRLEITEDVSGETRLELNLQNALYSLESTEWMLKGFVDLIGDMCKDVAV